MNWEITSTALLVTIIILLASASRHRAMLERRRDKREEYFLRYLPDIIQRVMNIDASERSVLSEGGEHLATRLDRIDERRKELERWIEERITLAPTTPKRESDYGPKWPSEK